VLVCVGGSEEQLDLPGRSAEKEKGGKHDQKRGPEPISGLEAEPTIGMIAGCGAKIPRDARASAEEHGTLPTKGGGEKGRKGGKSVKPPQGNPRFGATAPTRKRQRKSDRSWQSWGGRPKRKKRDTE